MRCETNISRVLWRINAAWFVIERTPTNRIEGRVRNIEVCAEAGQPLRLTSSRRYNVSWLRLRGREVHGSGLLLSDT